MRYSYLTTFASNTQLFYTHSHANLTFNSVLTLGDLMLTPYVCFSLTKYNWKGVLPIYTGATSVEEVSTLFFSKLSTFQLAQVGRKNLEKVASRKGGKILREKKNEKRGERERRRFFNTHPPWLLSLSADLAIIPSCPRDFLNLAAPSPLVCNLITCLGVSRLYLLQ